ncbi:efflux RND transporter periplasmic adaptor subunit [Thermosulfurimonas sp.]|uniref:efflux RND transporter periplasmic adaptor subunit n=1 Tax=Thermosulfurimonas sp. TaxID=2080236 RepID=UPI0025D78D4E|nr:efflux RND transporter periplasmic adaptor subunit [Thermosulfurimonas sp.]
MKDRFGINKKRLAILILVPLIGAIFWHLTGYSSPGSKNDNRYPQTFFKKTVAVKVARVRKGKIFETEVAYGTVIPAPGAVEIISIPFESQVRHIFVSEGEEISPGTPLLELAPSPDSLLKLEVAQTAYKMAKKKLTQVKKKKALKLATNQELLQAEQAFQEARLRLESLKKRGLGKTKTLKASQDGIVGKVYVQEGAIVPAGGPLLEIVTGGALEVRLGVEPEDVSRLKPGEKVRLFPVNRPAKSAIEGIIRAVSRSVNPSTRLVNVFVVPVSHKDLLLNEYVRGEIIVAAKEALLVPRSAVLPEGDHYVLFTIKDGRARKHTVKIGLETESQVEVISQDLHPGDLVVILGNYELEDGIAVRTEKIE